MALARERRPRLRRPPAAGEGHGESAVVERGRLAAAQAELAALRVATHRGELLDAGEVEREWIAILTAVRAGCLAIPSRIGSRLHLSPADVAEVEAEVRAVLTALGEDA